MKTIILVCLFSLSFSIVGFAESTDSRDMAIKRLEEADAELETAFHKLITEIEQKHKNDPFLNEWIEQLSISYEA
jgi:hypothetical protein